MSLVSMLIYKDIVQQGKRMLIGCVILSTFSIVAGLSEGSSISFPLLTTMLAAFSMTTALGSVYEDEQGGLVFLRSLPLNPSKLVLGRFLAALILVLIFTACVGLPLLIIRPATIELTELGAALVAAVSSGLVIVGFTFVLFYRLGYRAVRSGFLVLFVAIMALQVGIASLGEMGLFAGPPPQWLAAALGGIRDMAVSSMSSVVLLTLAVVLALYAFLGLLATRSLAHRDL